MKKQIILSSLAILAGALVFVPPFASARRGADDSVNNTHQEYRRDHQSIDDTQSPSTTTTQETVSFDTRGDGTLEDNSNNDSSSTPDVRGDGSREDNERETSTTTPNDNTTPVSSAEAVAIAQRNLPTKTFKKVENEIEHGVSVWSVRFQDGSRVDVSKSDGSILRVRDR